MRRMLVQYSRMPPQPVLHDHHELCVIGRDGSTDASSRCQRIVETGHISVAKVAVEKASLRPCAAALIEVPPCLGLSLCGE